MRRSPVLGSLLLVLSLGVACSTRDPVPTDAGSDAATVTPEDANTVDAFRPGRDTGPDFDLGTTARPASVLIPSAFDGTTELPLIILIHADGVTGQVQQMYLHLGEVARDSGAYLVLPTGTRNSMNFLHWNDGITEHGTVDDVGYLSGVLDAAFAMLPVDASRVYFVGHSNGGFMAYRMGCLESDRVTGIAVINAGDFPSSTTCVPTRPVSLLHMHGTADAVTPIDGIAGVYAGAAESTRRWAQRASCDLSMTHSPALFDMDSTVTGNETLATDYIQGCVGARVSLFTMSGSAHIPSFTRASAQVVVDWLLAQSSAP